MNMTTAYTVSRMTCGGCLRPPGPAMVPPPEVRLRSVIADRKVAVEVASDEASSR